MPNGVWNLTGGTTTEVGGGRFLKAYNADCDGVLTTGGLLVSQRAAGANKSVDIAAGDILITTIAGTAVYSSYETTAPTNKTVTDNTSGNPRWDAVSAYIDVAAAGASDNSGALKFKVTAGTPAASPSKPNGATIQADVGANNPYHVLGYAYAPNGFSQILNANDGTNGYIVDARQFAQPTEQVRRDYDTQPERVITGLLPATSATRTSDISIGEAYVRGRYVAKQRAESHEYGTVGVAKDTYVDIDNTGTFQYTEVADGAAEPAVVANSDRLAKVDTSAANAITSVTDLRNLYALGAKFGTANLNMSTAEQDVTGASVTFEVSQTSRLLLTAQWDIDGSAGTAAMNLNDIAVGYVDIDGTNATQFMVWKCIVANNGRINGTIRINHTLSSGVHTIKLQAQNITGNRGRITGAATSMVWEVKPGVIA